MNIENWFSIPILYHDLEHRELQKVQNEIDAAIPIVEKQDLENPWNDNVKTDFKYGKYDREKRGFLHDYNCETLKNKILDLSRKFLSQHNIESTEKYDIINSWINFYNKGDFQYEHNHMNRANHPFAECFLSGAYFYKSNGGDGDLVFSSPNILQTTCVDIFTPSFVHYPPKVGRILLFPSWLPHYVEMNKTDNQRISLSFNVGLFKSYQ